jgi:hypothetical protein
MIVLNTAPAQYADRKSGAKAAMNRRTPKGVST